MGSEGVRARYAELESLMEAITLQLDGEVRKLGFAEGAIALRGPQEATWQLNSDPYSGEDALIGEWRDARGGLLGELKFHADGSFHVEQDVLAPHPQRPQWFVEAVTAWGRPGEIKAEARLLPMPK